MSEDERFTDEKLDEIVSILEDGDSFYAESSMCWDKELASAADEASDAIRYLRRRLVESDRQRETLEHVVADLRNNVFGGSNEVTRAYSAPEEDRPLLPPWEKDA